MHLGRTLIGAIALGLAAGAVQGAAAGWTLLGDHALAAGLAGPRGGGLPFVGFTADGSRLTVVTGSGRGWASSDQGSNWQQLENLDAALLFRLERTDAASPEGVTVAVRHPYRAGWLYGLGQDLFLSQDDGAVWTALTNEAEQPMIGARPSAIAFDPADPERVFVATEAGLWRSADGGLSWVSLNAALPNFPSGRFRELGPGAPPIFDADGVGPALLPGGAQRWILAEVAQGGGSPASASVVFERFLDTGDLQVAPARPDRGPLTALAVSGGGELPVPGGRPVADLWLDPQSPLAAVAVFAGAEGPRVFRTVDGGLLWDDLTANLPAGEIRSVVASSDGDAVYVGGEAGVFYASVALDAPAPNNGWEAVTDDLPAAPVSDLFLSARTGRLYVAVEGFGVYRRRAPDVLRSMKLLNAADLSTRAITPGGLLTLLGSAVGRATINGLPAPVLLSTEEESQIQAPFNTRAGTGATVELATPQGARTLNFPVATLAPAIFTEDGEPLILDAGTGRLLDLMRPARPGSRILILAAGLGAVDPVWPAGVAAPLEAPPAVVAPVRAYLNGAEIEVHSATLAGGYIGAYWVEAELPTALQGGSGSLIIEAGANRSQAVRLLLAP